MFNNYVLHEIKKRWKELYPASKDKKGIICPICGHGSHGDGIVLNPKAQNAYSLKCFGCGFNGDIIELLQQQQGFDFETAVEYAAQQLNINLENEYQNIDITNKHDKQTKKDKRAAINNQAFYIQAIKELKNSEKANSYLQNRGITKKTIEHFKLGYVQKWRIKENTNIPTTERIIIPVTTSYYIARAIDENIDKKYAKMNSGSVDIFNFSIIPGNQKPVFVVEGVFDAMSLFEVGADAIALNSISNVNIFLEKLKQVKGLENNIFIICLDNEKTIPVLNALKALNRGLNSLGVQNIAGDITGRYKDANEALASDKQYFSHLVNKEIERASVIKIAKKDSALNYIKSEMQSDIKEQIAASCNKTGFKQLDDCSGGLFPGLYVVAAISSLGKTTFTHQIADNLAATGKDVLFFSLEQSKLELVSKSLARESAKIDMQKALSSLQIRQGQTDDILEQAINNYEKAAAYFNIVDGNFENDIDSITSYIEQYTAKNSCKPVVFIDYLQIIQPGLNNRTGSTKDNIDSIVKDLKRLSRKLNITIFLISAVNRANYLTPIDFESLKESGGIEYTADVIWGLQLECLNEDIFNESNQVKKKRERIKEAKNANPRKIELVCLKNRNGVANFSCVFDYFAKNDLFSEFISIDPQKTPFSNNQNVSVNII
jgi:replicative DNA helicase